MSGIVGIVHLNGSPVERELLHRLTQSLAFRGPDAQEIWLEQAVGLGHALLHTTWKSANEQQPVSVDGQAWITADARLDGRAELADKLGVEQLGKTDSELILRAYLVWGEGCVQFLMGDFAFAIWDSSQQRLFCARDRFGVKLFYYALVGHCFIFSNTLSCLRQHPLISDRLNEQAIGDFLLFEMNYNLETTVWADIQRLPRAHTLSVTTEIQQQRYWELPVYEPIRYRRSQDYIDQFQELMAVAVGDRLNTERVAIYMSGGLDSTAIAATAVEVGSGSTEIQAFTTVYDRLIPSQERYYSGLVAQHLGIPIHYWSCDDYQFYQGWERPELKGQEPYHRPLALGGWEQSQQVARYSRVALYGEGGDEAFAYATVAEMLKMGSASQVAVDVLRCLLIHKLRPRWGTGVYAWWRRRKAASTYPPWLRTDFARRLHLVERWQQVTQKPVADAPRAKAYQGMVLPLWSALFESQDPGVSLCPIEVRFPFLDLRLLSYLLALPPLPWCVGKQLLRVAMKGKLPPEVLQRPKTPLVGSPLAQHLHQGPNPWQHLAQLPIRDYVDINLLTAATQSLDPSTAWLNLRPVSLGYWLMSGA
ncbi:MAG: asparagine synthase-related protein [Cyanophyceae cyanobacterium]